MVIHSHIVYTGISFFWTETWNFQVYEYCTKGTSWLLLMSNSYKCLRWCYKIHKIQSLQKMTKSSWCSPTLWGVLIHIIVSTEAGRVFLSENDLPRGPFFLFQSACGCARFRRGLQKTSLQLCWSEAGPPDSLWLWHRAWGRKSRCKSLFEYCYLHLLSFANAILDLEQAITLIYCTAPNFEL